MGFRLYNGKWDGIWDKPKYQMIRDKIESAFKGIEFVEETHQYFYKGVELIPTSNVCHAFRLEFDEDAQAERCSNKYFNEPSNKYFQMTKEEILESWHANSKRATDHGTKIHLFGENCAYFMMKRYDRLTEDFKKRIMKDPDGKEYVEAAEPKEEAIVRFWTDLPVSIVPILFEVQMFDLSWGVSGTADLLFVYDPHIESDDNYEELRTRLYLMDYKGLPLGTPILTTNGWKTMGTLEEGEYVYDKDGNETKILHTSEIHHNPCYKITFDNGDSIIADHEHRWTVTYQGENIVMNTEDIIKYLNDNCYIPKLEDINSKSKINLKIVSVEKTETVPTRCIEVDSPSHTYLCGKNLLVTHNTNADLYKSFGNMLPPFDELPDNDLGGYKIQAGIYSHFIMNLGFGFVARALIWLRDSGNYEKVKMESFTEILRKYLKEHPVKELLHSHH